MKKSILSILLVFTILFLGGCTQQKNVEISDNYIMLSIDQNTKGSTKQSIVFSVNSSFLRINSKNIAEELKFKQNLIKNVEELRNEFLFSFALIYMQNPIEEFKINQGVLLSQVGYNSQNDYVGFELTFTSLGAWQYYHSTNNSQEKEEKNKKNGNIFFEKQYSEGIFPFSANINHDLKVGDKYKNCYLSALSGLSFENITVENYKPDYVYNYSTYYPKFHSNADIKFRAQDNKYHHVWIENNLNQTSNITLTNYIIYKGWWIFFTLLICLGGMVLAIIYVKKSQKSET